MMIKSNFLLVLLVAATLRAATAQLSDEDLEASGKQNALKQVFDFQKYKNLFSKHYESILEELRRRKLFLARAISALASIIRFKHRQSSSYLGINQFSDWTSNELESLWIPRGEVEQQKKSASQSSHCESIKSQPDQRKQPNPIQSALNSVSYWFNLVEDWQLDVQPEQVHFDLRRSKCFSRPRAQGRCGSCYTFSTIALYEWLHCRQTGKLVEFSEQFALDCGHLTTQRPTGCQGGFERDVGSLVARFGLMKRSDYPYTARQGKCPLETDGKDRVELVEFDEPGLEFVPEFFFESYLEKKPILLGIAEIPNFLHYGGGVDDPKECDLDKGHSMLLVGSGKQDGKDYWLFRNSYSTFWGEKGYYKLSKASNCLQDGRRGLISLARVKKPRK